MHNECQDIPEAVKVQAELDQEFIHRLEELKDVNKLDKDERLMRMLGITTAQMDKRKALEDDRIFNLLCPDGVTLQDRQSFNKNTKGFLNFIYDDFIIKSVAVPGTEATDLFKDTIHMQEVNRYLEMITISLSG